MQTTVQTAMTIGVPGQVADLVDSQILAYANYSKKLDRVTVSADDTTTTVTINGTAFTYTGGGGETKAQIAALLYAAVNAGSVPVTAYYTAAAEYFDVESDTPGTTTTVVGTASCVVTARIGNAAAIGYGLFVVQDEKDDDKASVPILAADITTLGNGLGITVFTQANEQQYQTAGGVGYALADCMSVMRKGRIYVEVEDAVTAGAQCYVRYASGAGGSTLGAFRSDADTASAAALSNAYFRTNTAAGGIAIVEINLP